MVPVDALSPVHEQFQAVTALWYGTLFSMANWTFNILVIAEIVTAVMLRMGSGGSLFWHVLVERTFRILFFKLVLVNSGWLIPAAINGFIYAGSAAGGAAALNPQQIAIQGIDIAAKMLWQMMSWSFFLHPASVLVGVFCALGIVGAYALIALQLSLTLIEMYIVTGAGVFMLGFGGWRGTSELASRYISYVVGVGIKLFVIYLIIGAGADLATLWATMVNEVTIENFSTPLALLMGIGAFGLISWWIPKVTSSLATGALGMGLQDAIETTSFASRVAMSTVAGPVVGAAALGHAAGIGKQTSLDAGGGFRGAVLGMRAMGGSLVNEAAAAAVPRLSRGQGNLQRQHQSMKGNNS